MIIIIGSNEKRDRSEKYSVSAAVNTEKTFAFTIKHLFDTYDVVATTDTQIQTIHRFKTESEAQRLLGGIIEAIEEKRYFFDVESFLYAEANPNADKWQ